MKLKRFAPLLILMLPLLGTTCKDEMMQPEEIDRINIKAGKSDGYHMLRIVEIDGIDYLVSSGGGIIQLQTCPTYPSMESIWKVGVTRGIRSSTQFITDQTKDPAQVALEKWPEDSIKLQLYWPTPGPKPERKYHGQ